MAIIVEDQEVFKVTNGNETSTGGSSAYTVRSINSYKERLNRNPVKYFRRV